MIALDTYILARFYFTALSLIELSASICFFGRPRLEKPTARPSACSI